MIARILVAAISIFIGACASSGPETAAPTATASSAGVEPVASVEPAAAPASEMHALDAPDVPLTARAAPESNEDQIVCRREIVTGSKFSQKVCRRRADIDDMAEDAQDATRRMQKTGSQMEKGVSN